MSANEYLIAWAVVSVVVAALAFGAWALRSWLVPEWTGAYARLAEIVIAIAMLVLVSELAGSVGMLRRPALVVGVLFVAGAFAAIGVRGRRRRRSPELGRDRLAVVRRSPRWEIAAAACGVGLVATQWAGKVAFALAAGMTHPDSMWYHGPYAASFAQHHSALVAFDRRDALHAYANHTSELLHAVFIALVGRDILSPLLNVGWFALALLAAWCLGARFGAGALCVLAAALACGLPTMVSTQPGQASNDLAAAGLLLAAVALLASSNLRMFATACAALAAGLAVSVKVTAGAPVVVLTIGVIALTIARKRIRVGAVWCATVLVMSVYWFLRNIYVAKNPLPYYDVKIGPVHLAGRLDHGGDTVARYLFNLDKWHLYFRPGLHFGFGWAYPAVLGIAFLGIVLTLVRARSAVFRIAAVAYLSGLVVYLFTPFTADYGGQSFKYNVRYVLPSLVGAIVLFALACATRRRIWRVIAAASMLLVIVFDVFARNYERVPAWPHEARVAAPLAWVVAGAFVLVRYALPARHRAAWLSASAITVVVAAIIVGWPIQHRYFANRYAHTGLPSDTVSAPFRYIRNARVAVLGGMLIYPYFGADLSNRVEHPQTATGSNVRAVCRRNLARLSRDDYLVLLHEPLFYEFVPDPQVAAERAVTKIAGDKAGTVYKVHGPLLGKAC